MRLTYRTWQLSKKLCWLLMSNLQNECIKKARSRETRKVQESGLRNKSWFTFITISAHFRMRGNGTTSRCGLFLLASQRESQLFYDNRIIRFPLRNFWKRRVKINHFEEKYIWNSNMNLLLWDSNFFFPSRVSYKGNKWGRNLLNMILAKLETGKI